ncbi:MAG: tellurite resistance TerB family protein, partial [Thiobacillus sp.]|nr:tellurite resistance TerB family protein [Thiobacillus sp.]
MNTERSILAIALFAAFADGEKHDREREHLRDIAESLGSAGELAGLYQDVLLKRTSLDAAVAALSDAGARQLAYEMALGVCEADGRMSAAERDFLARLKTLLQLDAGAASQAEAEADRVVELTAAAAPVAVAGA